MLCLSFLPLNAIPYILNDFRQFSLTLSRINIYIAIYCKRQQLEQIFPPRVLFPTCQLTSLFWQIIIQCRFQSK